MRKTLFIAFISILLFSCERTKEPRSPTIARVGRTVLDQAALDRIIISSSDKSYSKAETVSDWVNRELLYSAAHEAGIENDETLQTQVEKYRKDLIGRTFMENYIASNINVDNSEIRDYYDKNRDIFMRKSDGAKVIHFLVQVDSIAEYITDILRNSIKDVDRKSLLSNYQADIMDIEKGSLISDLDGAVFSARSNVIGPIKTIYGYHVIEILDRYRSGSQIDLDKAYDEIYQIIYNQKKQQRAVALLDSLRNHYTVKIYLENN